jgi:Trk-type K+ transport system membrane component
MDYSASYDPAAAAAATAVAGGLVIGWVIFWVIFGGVGFILWLWALIDCIRRQFTNPNDKVLWLVLIILIAWIGPILYLIIGRKKGTIPGAAAK